MSVYKDGDDNKRAARVHVTLAEMTQAFDLPENIEILSLNHNFCERVTLVVTGPGLPIHTDGQLSPELSLEEVKEI